MRKKMMMLWIKFMWPVAACCIPLQALALETKSLGIEEAVRLARQANPEILKALIEVENTRARLVQARAWPDPELVMEWSDMPGLFSFGKAEERKIGLSQALEVPGKRKARILMFQTAVQLAEAHRQKVETAVVARVKRACYRIIFLQKKRQTAQAVAELLEQFKEMAAGRFQTQTGTYLDLLRSKIELAKAANEQIEIELEHSAAGTVLSRLLGWESHATIIITDELGFQPIGGELAEVLKAKLTAHPSLLGADLAVGLGRQSITLAKKSIWPDLTIGLFQQRLSGQPPFNANNFTGAIGVNAWAVELGFSLPFVWGERRKGGLAEARNSLRLSQIERVALQNKISLAVTDAFHAVQANAAKVKNFKAALLKDTEDMLHDGMARYGSNKIDAFNLLDMFRLYHEARLGYFQALCQYYISLADLEAAGIAEEEDNEN